MSATVMNGNKLEFRIRPAFVVETGRAESASCDVFLNGEKVATIGSSCALFSAQDPNNDQPLYAGDLGVTSFYHGVDVMKLEGY